MRNLFAAVAVAFAAGPALTQPGPKPDDKTLVTKTYNLKPLLGDRGKASGIADTDAVVKLILETLPVGELKPGTDGPQLVERDGGKLEVRATAKLHGEIKDLLDALERLTDLAVDVKADVIELDPAAFEKLAKALPKAGKGKPGSPVLSATGEEVEEREPADAKAFAEVNKILKAGKVVQTSTARFANGVEATLSARQSVQTYKNLPEPNALPVVGKPVGNPLIVKEGFKLVGVPVVSADRRFVRLKLTEQSVVVTGIKKRDFGEIAGERVVMQSLETEDLGATGSAAVADGGTLLFHLTYAPKDKVWVVVLHPTIFIQAEEDELKKPKK